MMNSFNNMQHHGTYDSQDPHSIFYIFLLLHIYGEHVLHRTLHVYTNLVCAMVLVLHLLVNNEISSYIDCNSIHALIRW